jgi:hypothetical protein
MSEQSFPASQGSGTDFAVFTDILGNERPVYVLGDTEYNTLLLPVGVALHSDGGNDTVAVASGHSGNTIVVNQPSFLCKVLITTANSNALVIYDNASTNSGTIIGYVAASAVAGTVANFNMPALLGITVAGNSNNPAFTLSFINQTQVDVS